ncbi:MAG: inosine/xanthosine triphosphatase [Melioribacter sp.]|nr:inosine/xanthosine triphosphatase [Melioribacter sp.]
MKVLVGSKNPVKVDSVKEAFSNYFEDIEVIGIEVSSNVSHQPINEETFFGAQNRTYQLKHINQRENIKADFFVGIEGGIVKQFDRWFAFGCMCIMDREGRVSFGTSSHFELPDFIVNRLLSGVELGDIIDELTGQKNTKQKEGAIGYFTNGVVSRKELYVEGLKVALIPFIHKEIFLNSKGKL